MNEIERQDPWLQQLVATTAAPKGAPSSEVVAPAAALDGRVLRAKIGYNPNSSSVGSVVTVLVWSATTASVVMSLLRTRIEAEREAARPEGASETNVP
jgi:hypothetical protein